LSGCDLTSVDFRLSNLKDACLALSECQYTDFSGVFFSKTIIGGVNFSGCKFSCPSVFSIDLSLAASLEKARYILDGEIECELTKPPITIYGLESPLVIMNGCLLSEGEVKNLNNKNIYQYVSERLKKNITG